MGWKVGGVLLYVFGMRARKWPQKPAAHKTKIFLCVCVFFFPQLCTMMKVVVDDVINCLSPTSHSGLRDGERVRRKTAPRMEPRRRYSQFWSLALCASKGSAPLCISSTGMMSGCVFARARRVLCDIGCVSSSPLRPRMPPSRASRQMRTLALIGKIYMYIYIHSPYV